MIHFLPAIWVFPGQFIVYRIGSIGRDCVMMFVLTWHHVLFVWPGSLSAHEGLLWDMSMWDTDGIWWPWIHPERQSVRPGNGGLFFLDGRKRARCLTRLHWQFQHIVCRFGMPSVIHSNQGREFENKEMQ